MTTKCGSLLFGTSVIKADEYVLLASVMKENGNSIQESVLQIEAFDNILSMQKIHSIITAQRFTKTGRIRKNSSFQYFIEKRIEKLIEDLDSLNCH
jgi:hypothetical protein